MQFVISTIHVALNLRLIINAFLNVTDGPSASEAYLAQETIPEQIGMKVLYFLNVSTYMMAPSFSDLLYVPSEAADVQSSSPPLAILSSSGVCTSSGAETSTSPSFQYVLLTSRMVLVKTDQPIHSHLW